MRSTRHAVTAVMVLAMGCSQVREAEDTARASATTAEFRFDGDGAATRGWATLAMNLDGRFSLRLRGEPTDGTGAVLDGQMRVAWEAQPFARNADGSADVRLARRDDDPDPNARVVGVLTVEGAERRVYQVVEQALHVARDRTFALTLTLRAQDPTTLAPTGDALVLRGAGTLTVGCPAAFDDAASTVRVALPDGAIGPAAPTPDDASRSAARCRAVLGEWVAPRP